MSRITSALGLADYVVPKPNFGELHKQQYKSRELHISFLFRRPTKFCMSQK